MTVTGIRSCGKQNTGVFIQAFSFLKMYKAERKSSPTFTTTQSQHAAAFAAFTKDLGSLYMYVPFETILNIMSMLQLLSDTMN